MTLAKKEKLASAKKTVKKVVKTAEHKVKTAEHKAAPHHCGCMFHHDR